MWPMDRFHLMSEESSRECLVGRVHSYRLIATVFMLEYLLLQQKAHAIPPPDFAMNAGIQVIHIFGIIAFFCSTACSFLYRKYSAMFDSPLKRSLALVTILLGFLLAWHLAFLS